MGGIGPVEMGKKTSCVGIEVTSVAAAIEVYVDEVELVEVNRIKLVSLELNPFEHSPVEGNPAMAGLMEVDLVDMSLGMRVDDPVAGVLAEQ